MIYHDLHTHTIHSDGSATVRELYNASQEKNIGLGVSDHLFCEKMLTLDDICRYLDDLDQYDLLKGCEANIGEDYGMPDALAARFDYVIASVHGAPDLHRVNSCGPLTPLSHYFGARAGDDGVIWRSPFDHAQNESYLEMLLPVIEHTMQTQRMDIYGHCTVLPFYEELAGSLFLLDWENALLALCKKYDVAVEISGLWQEPNLAMVKRGKEMGIRFTIGSDCHSLDRFAMLDYAVQIMNQANIEPDDLFLPKRVH